ncbi:hypothetical protein J4465_02165 [Candidatus Pacearchaeota archaeon]|nr:hypothetical protein [Candidatus Pacearchaeota archaeon]
MDEKKIKLAIMTASAKTLEYMKKNPKVSQEEVFQHVMKIEKAKGEAKIGAMASVSKTHEYKEKNPGASDKEIMQRIMNESEEIIGNIVLE